MLQAIVAGYFAASTVCAGAVYVFSQDSARRQNAGDIAKITAVSSLVTLAMPKFDLVMKLYGGLIAGFNVAAFIGMIVKPRYYKSGADDPGDLKILGFINFALLLPFILPFYLFV